MKDLININWNKQTDELRIRFFSKIIILDALKLKEYQDKKFSYHRIPYPVTSSKHGKFYREVYIPWKIRCQCLKLIIKPVD